MYVIQNWQRSRRIWMIEDGKSCDLRVVQPVVYDLLDGEMAKTRKEITARIWTRNEGFLRVVWKIKTEDNVI